MAVIAVVNHGLGSRGHEFFVGGLVDAPVESTVSGGKSVLTVGLAKLVFTLDAGNVATIAWDVVGGGLVLYGLVGSLDGLLVSSIAGDLALFGFEHSSNY